LLRYSKAYQRFKQTINDVKQLVIKMTS